MRGVRKYLIVALFIICTCIGVSVYIVYKGKNVDDLATLRPSEVNAVRHRSYSSDPKLYAITASSTYAHTYTDFVFGGIVSHHLLANIDISNFFAKWSSVSLCS